MEKEQLKVCTKTPGLGFQNILCIKSPWHRLMMLEGLDEAGGGCRKLEEGAKLQSHYWPWMGLWRPGAGLPLSSSGRQAVRRVEAQEHTGWHICTDFTHRPSNKDTRLIRLCDQG